MPIRVLLIDDHQMFRSALRESLAKHADLLIVGEAGDVDAARALIDATGPDVVVLDLVLPGVGGLQLLRELGRRPHPRALVLSMHAPEDFAPEVLTTGAAGYVHKGQPIADLVKAITEVARGDVYLPERVARPEMLVARSSFRRPTGIETLSGREREVFQLVVEGRSNKEVATTLGVSVKTVETHRANINRKLVVNSTGQLVRYAAVRGLVSPRDPGALTP
jgi:DNA-binding NarL/FixJ family response regulator